MVQIPINASGIQAVGLRKKNDETEILLMKRVEGFWSHLSGGIENSEKAHQAVIREFREEADLELKYLYSADYCSLSYRSQTNEMDISPCFVAYFSSMAQVKLNHEHTDFKWCSLEEALNLAPFPSQKQLYSFVWDNFVENSPSEFLKIKVEQ